MSRTALILIGVIAVAIGLVGLAASFLGSPAIATYAGIAAGLLSLLVVVVLLIRRNEARRGP